MGERTRGMEVLNRAEKIQAVQRTILHAPQANATGLEVRAPESMSRHARAPRRVCGEHRRSTQGFVETALHQGQG